MAFSTIKRCSDTYWLTIGVEENSFHIIIHLSADFMVEIDRITCIIENKQ